MWYRKSDDCAHCCFGKTHFWEKIAAVLQVGVKYEKIENKIFHTFIIIFFLKSLVL